MRKIARLTVVLGWLSVPEKLERRVALHLELVAELRLDCGVDLRQAHVGAFLRKLFSS